MTDETAVADEPEDEDVEHVGEGVAAEDETDSPDDSSAGDTPEVNPEAAE